MWWDILYTISLLLVVSSSTDAIASSHDKNNDIFESWGSTKVKVSRFRYTWTIKNFSFCEEENHEYLMSPYFSDGINDEYKWLLVLYPKGYSDKEEVSLYIQVNSNINRAAYKLAILDENDQEIIVDSSVDRFDSSYLYGIENFAKRDFILNEENGVLVNDELKIFCEINATISSESSSGNFKQSTPNGHLMQDLAFLLESQDLSDVTLLVRGKEFKSHKAILAIRSLTFKTMFEHDASISRVEIANVDPIVVNEMLRYIYTDEVSNLQYLALDLLAVSENYNLDGLKSICENSMSANLTIENAAEYFIVGDTYSAEELKIHAKNFIFTHIASVVHTLGFKSMIHSHPHLLEEVFMN